MITIQTQAEIYSDIKKEMFANGTPFPRNRIPEFIGCNTATAQIKNKRLPIRVFADGSIYTEVNEKGKRLLLSFDSRLNFEERIISFIHLI